MSIDLPTHHRVLSLLQEAKENPEEDAPRLVLADWLEDHGDTARAEHIRLQCCLAPGALPLEPGIRADCQRRSQELLDRHGGAWLGPLWRCRLSVACWHRGLLTVGLSRWIAPEGIAEVLPWIDTVLFHVSSRLCLQHVAHVLSLTQLNHVILDLRRRLREASLLQLLALLQEGPWLRTLSFAWPLGMLRRQEPKAVPTLSDGFFSTLGELPLARHLTHLASMPGWSAQQADLIRSLGIEPVTPADRLWMHSRPAASFRRQGGSSCPGGVILYRINNLPS
jgi:uncharacterized protein (TIGR02996 family)